MSKPEPWMSIYPSVSDVMIAALSTLSAWDANLPPPQTDVEHTVRNRIKKRMWEEARRIEPELMGKVDDVFDRAEKLMGLEPGSLNKFR